MFVATRVVKPITGGLPALYANIIECYWGWAIQRSSATWAQQRPAEAFLAAVVAVHSRAPRAHQRRHTKDQPMLAWQQWWQCTTELHGHNILLLLQNSASSSSSSESSYDCSTNPQTKKAWTKAYVNVNFNVNSNFNINIIGNVYVDVDVNVNGT